MVFRDTYVTVSDGVTGRPPARIPADRRSAVCRCARRRFVPRLGGYDLVALILILARGALGALQFTAGWLLATKRPQGFALGQAAFVAAAVLTVFDVGMGLAPTGVFILAALAGSCYRRMRSRRRFD